MKLCLTISRSKTHEKNFWGPKLGLKLGLLAFSQVCIISFFDIPKDCRLGQFLTSSGSEKIKKKKKKCGQNKDLTGPNRGQNEISHHFLSYFI